MVPTGSMITNSVTKTSVSRTDVEHAAQAPSRSRGGVGRSGHGGRGRASRSSCSGAVVLQPRSWSVLPVPWWSLEPVTTRPRWRAIAAQPRAGVGVVVLVVDLDPGQPGLAAVRRSARPVEHVGPCRAPHGWATTVTPPASATSRDHLARGRRRSGRRTPGRPRRGAGERLVAVGARRRGGPARRRRAAGRWPLPPATVGARLLGRGRSPSARSRSSDPRASGRRGRRGSGAARRARAAYDGSGR